MRRLLVALSLVACGEQSATSTTSAPILGGGDASDEAVVAIHPRRTQCAQPPPVPSCSGTLIAKRVVLTAAHCVEPEASGVGYEVAFGPDGAAASATRRVVIQVARHPQFVRATYAFDVALLLLGEEAPGAPVALETPLPIAVVGDRVRAVGYGVDTRDGKPGIKRAGTMRVRSVADDAFEATPDPAMSCVGDSGGPVFLEREAGAPALIGVTSSGDVPCKEYARNFRIDLVRSFIDPFVSKANAMPPGPPMAAISPESFCSMSCTTSVECAGGLFCREGRCVMTGTVPGNFSKQCGAGRACGDGETCARFWTEGDFECLCHKPCEGSVTPPPFLDGGPPIPPGNTLVHAAGGGCATAHSQPSSLLILCVVAAAMARRRVTARRPRSTCRCRVCRRAFVRQLAR